MHIPGHDLVMVNFDLGTNKQRVRKVQKLERTGFEKAPLAGADMQQEATTVEQMKKMLDMRLQKILEPYMSHWGYLMTEVERTQGQLQQAAMDALWESWSWLAEESHIALLQEVQQLTDSEPKGHERRKRGRGRKGMIQKATLAPQQRCAEGRPKTIVLRELSALSKNLKVIRNWMLRDHRGERLTSAPVAVEQAWEALL